jgi:hypothetical protein
VLRQGLGQPFDASARADSTPKQSPDPKFALAASQDSTPAPTPLADLAVQDVPPSASASTPFRASSWPTCDIELASPDELEEARRRIRALGPSTRAIIARWLSLVRPQTQQRH